MASSKTSGPRLTSKTPRVRNHMRRLFNTRPRSQIDPKILPDESEKTSEKKTYLVTLGVRSYVDYDRALSENPQMRLDQKAYVQKMMKEGHVIAHGPLRGLIFPPNSPQDVAVWAVRGKSKEEAQEMVNNSPYVVHRVTPACKILSGNAASSERRNLENLDTLETLQAEINSIQRDLEASRRVHQLLRNELDSAHAELNHTRRAYHEYNREINLQRINWLSSASVETFRRLQPIYEGFDRLQEQTLSTTDDEADLEEAFQTIARDFINLYEQEIDGVSGRQGNPISQWVTKVFGSPTDLGSNEERSEQK
eukprot:CAMPEP_0114487262 /NCGR_PEP_ID=MMETSP0109-20121206/671_1 /TAXON_ID=29199 /ORGANISM="Chlorarachnion reptans, Strain CCCM449" /LENGTH=308 /DNA_ID=CAMNT_0001663513 /DNA_START=365 /DNA_END=1291 /DNA_ORIENTATION=+